MREELRHIVRDECIDYLLRSFPTIRQLSLATEQELLQLPGIGPAKAKELMAILSLSKQLLQENAEAYKRVQQPGDVYDIFRDIALHETEHVYALYLDTKNQVIGRRLISSGTLNASFIHPRDFFALGVRMRAAAVIAAHNHPSGDPTPSKEDIEVTRRLVEAGRIVGIEVLDHVIMGNGRQCSMKEKGLV